LETLTMLQFDLPHPPSINHYWRRVGNRVFISRAGRLFRERVCQLLAAQQTHPLAGPLAVEIEIFPPDNRRRDIDNVQKALLDALQHGGAYHDDSQIISLNITKRNVVPEGRTLVTIEKSEC
jgi:Holliday junction resolvase RusA-like endonuclease